MHLCRLVQVVTNLTRFLKQAFGNNGSGLDLQDAASASFSAQPKSQNTATLFHFRRAWPPVTLKPGAALSSVATSQGVAGSSAPGTSATTGSMSANGSNKSLSNGGVRGLSELGSAQASAEAANAVRHAALQLVRQLLECWNECAPAQLATSPESESLKALVEILQSVVLLTHNTGLLPAAGATSAATANAASATSAPTVSIAGGWQYPAAGTHAPAQTAAGDVGGSIVDVLIDLVAKKVAPHFPAVAPAVKPSAPVQELLIHYNLLCAHLMAKLSAAEQLAAPAAPVQTERGQGTKQRRPWRETLVQYYIGESTNQGWQRLSLCMKY